MTNWFGFAIAAALLYGLHQIFTKLASEHVSDGLGALIVEASAVITIAVYLGALYASGRWMQRATVAGIIYSVVTGICVGVGTIMFFLLFQRGGPLSAVPAILAGGAAVMALAGLVLFREPATPMRLAGVSLALIGLYLVR
jgi:bacterial/archaeal transporter family protein